MGCNMQTPSKLAPYKYIFNELLNLIYPAKCLVCSKVLPHDGLLAVCGFCSPAFEPAGEEVTGDFSFDRSFSFFEYNDSLRAIIHDIKFGKKAHKMAALTQAAINLRGDKLPFYEPSRVFDAIVPVPLHKNRLKERGFNQAYVMAKVLSGFIGVPVDDGICERRVDNAPQSRVGRDGRVKNVTGVFSLTNDSNARGKSYLLVDDIFTSGETLNSCAKAFKNAGAADISCVTIAVSSMRNPV